VQIVIPSSPQLVRICLTTNSNSQTSKTHLFIGNLDRNPVHVDITDDEEWGEIQRLGLPCKPNLLQYVERAFEG
jgi:hypothetical protein